MLTYLIAIGGGIYTTGTPPFKGSAEDAFWVVVVHIAIIALLWFSLSVSYNDRRKNNSGNPQVGQRPEFPEAEETDGD